MDYKKTNAPTNTITRDMADFREKTGNVYESIAIMGKRANQISTDINYYYYDNSVSVRYTDPYRLISVATNAVGA